MSGRVELVFPSYIYRGRWPVARIRDGLNRDLAREIAQLEKIDDHGRAWSREHYVGGYSSYSSHCQLHETSPNFRRLREGLDRHIAAYAKALNWDLRGRRLVMTTCWANAMGYGTHHTLHTHPLCAVSGVYYVNLPRGSSPFKIEDPRMGFLMAAPPRKASAPRRERNFLVIQPQAGEFILFESWMRHEVPPHRGRNRRLSISFNYELV